MVESFSPVISIKVELVGGQIPSFNTSNSAAIDLGFTIVVQPKYIGKLLEQAKLRAVEHDIAFERNLAKERAKEDHLFPDKEKFVTKAYKQKLIEQGKWLDEDRLKEIKEQAEEVRGFKPPRRYACVV